MSKLTTKEKIHSAIIIISLIATFVCGIIGVSKYTQNDGIWLIATFTSLMVFIISLTKAC